MSGVQHGIDLISFLLAPLHSSWLCCPGLALTLALPSFLKAGPQVAQAAQGVG